MLNFQENSRLVARQFIAGIHPLVSNNREIDTSNQVEFTNNPLDCMFEIYSKGCLDESWIKEGYQLMNESQVTNFDFVNGKFYSTFRLIINHKDAIQKENLPNIKKFQDFFRRIIDSAIPGELLYNIDNKNGKYAQHLQELVKEYLKKVSVENPEYVYNIIKYRYKVEVLKPKKLLYARIVLGCDIFTTRIPQSEIDENDIFKDMRNELANKLINKYYQKIIELAKNGSEDDIKKFFKNDIDINSFSFKNNIDKLEKLTIALHKAIKDENYGQGIMSKIYKALMKLLNNIFGISEERQIRWTKDIKDSEDIIRTHFVRAIDETSNLQR